MNYQSVSRQARRRALRANNKTFTERVQESIRAGKPIEDVKFTQTKPSIKVG